ncbi:SDR family NAD(P)-dependent oxidoreductase [Gemmobacter denitrificans]|uniref:SDR family NAD(P)-dependent oxidoreductase n=1 Tax=Gemmobacter denitrificans TaxID=3123040 RepID=A0ABU8BSV5_9RHOB
MFDGQRWWLVGASEGLGFALAQAMAARGAGLILSARNAERLSEAAATLPAGAEIVPLDVADRDSIAAAGERIGPVDGMVWLAGVYWPMRAQDWDSAKVETMCDTNFTGCARVIGAVLPGMLARKRGHIVITGSLSGFRGLPGAVGYGASKAGCMSLAETLHADLRGSGIKVQLANPGFIRTRLTALNDFAMPQIMEPDAAALHMIRLMESNRFSASFPTPFQWLFRAANFLPDGLYYRLFAPK